MGLIHWAQEWSYGCQLCNEEMIREQHLRLTLNTEIAIWMSHDKLGTRTAIWITWWLGTGIAIRMSHDRLGTGKIIWMSICTTNCWWEPNSSDWYTQHRNGYMDVRLHSNYKGGSISVLIATSGSNGHKLWESACLISPRGWPQLREWQPNTQQLYYSCPDCPSCTANAIKMGLATRAI